MRGLLKGERRDTCVLRGPLGPTNILHIKMCMDQTVGACTDSECVTAWCSRIELRRKLERLKEAKKLKFLYTAKRRLVMLQISFTEMLLAKKNKKKKTAYSESLQSKQT